MALHVHSSNSQGSLQKRPDCPLTDDWIRKMWSVQMMKYYSTLKKAKVPSTTAAMWVNLSGTGHFSVCFLDKPGLVKTPHPAALPTALQPQPPPELKEAGPQSPGPAPPPHRWQAVRQGSCQAWQPGFLAGLEFSNSLTHSCAGYTSTTRGGSLPTQDSCRTGLVPWHPQNRATLLFGPLGGPSRGNCGTLALGLVFRDLGLEKKVRDRDRKRKKYRIPLPRKGNLNSIRILFPVRLGGLVMSPVCV